MLTEWLQGQEQLEDGDCISSNQNRNAYPKPAILRSLSKTPVSRFFEAR